MATKTRRPVFDEESRFLDRFGLLLLLTVASITMLSLADLNDATSNRTQQAASVLTALLTAAALLVALRAAGLSRRWQRPVDAVVAIGVIASVTLIVAGVGINGDGADSAPWFTLVVALLAPIVVVRRLLTHRRVRRATLLGAVSAYLLIPVAFFYVFLTIERVQSGTFFAQEESTGSFMYFSLTTLTTVGYGDLVAVAQPGRLFANAEAVIGQIYLVTFVGLLIGILTQQNREE
jgi:hypothetical protein